MDSMAKTNIASEPYQLCFCGESGEYDCSGKNSIEVYRGQNFNVSLLAVAQGDVKTSANITAKISPTARLKLNQNLQSISQQCTNVTYNIYSTEELVLYPDGPC